MPERRVGARAAAAICLVLTGVVWTPVGATPVRAATSPSSDVPPAPLTAPQPTSTASALPLSAPADTGTWGPLLDWGVQAKHMATLSTGKVLVWSTGDNARVWDPSTGTFTLAPATFGDLHCAGQSTLADGRVIVVGGQDGATHNGINVTALFDPISQTWTRGADMTDKRWYATSTTLADGRVLATSGDAPDGTRSTVPEIYDPVSNTWTRMTGATRSQGLYPFMFVLPSGRVYEAGAAAGTASMNVEGLGSWTSGPTSPWSTSAYSESAVMYLPGKILRAGGGDPARARAAVVDMTVASPAWREIAPMNFARRRMNLTILADGTVMAMGGTASGDNAAAAVLPAEIWDPTTEAWTTVAAMDEARMYHSSAVLLPDGRVVIGGGEAAGRLRAQVYSPPYLFKGPRPTISAAPGTAAYGSTFAVTSPEAADITSVSLMRPTAATHALDMNQRYVPLAFTRSGSTLTVTAPPSGGVAPPGDYMLVIKNGAGVPSVASWVRVGTSGSLQPGSISGTVTGASSGAPIVGATVSASGRSTTTDGSGRYTLTDIAAGDAQVSFQAAGFATTLRSVTVSGGATSTLSVAMAAPGGVAGRVTSSTSGSALPGVSVGYPGGVTVTDAAGAYVVAGLPAGTHTLTFATSGHVTATREVAVQADQTTTLDVALAATATWVAGEVRDAVTTAPITDATVAIDTGQTTTTDGQGRYHIDLPPGTYGITVTAPGHVTGSGTVVINGGSYASLDFNLDPDPEPTSSTFVPVADASIRNSSPTKNYGREVDIRLRQGNAANTISYNGYLRFDVTGLAGRAVTSARLRLRVIDAGPHGGTIHATSSAWAETGITWNNAPPAGATTLATIGSVVAGQWVDIPLPAGSVSGDGSVSFAVVAGNANSVYYSSREGTDPPQLVVDMAGATPTSTPTPTPTATPTPTPTPAALRSITFEGGLLDPTTGVDVVSGAVSLETASAINGTASARFANTTGYLQESFPATADTFVTLRLRLVRLPTGSPRVLMLSNGGTTVGNLLLTSSGRLRLRNNTTTIGVDSAPLQVGSTYLIGIHQGRGTGANAVLEAFLAPDGGTFSTPFARLANGSWTTSADRIRLGATNGTAVDFTVDDLQIGSGAMPGPVAQAGGTILAAAVPGSSYQVARLASWTSPGSITFASGFACPI